MEGKITGFMKKNYRHFNAATLVEASEAYRRHLEAGGKMMVTLAGAMSTAELGISLAEMIRQGKVHAITCTGANLEEDIFNLVANKHYKRVPGYRYFTAQDEKKLYEQGFNRVTDTCIPEEEAMRRVEGALLEIWKRDEKENVQRLPHESMCELLLSGRLEKFYSEICLMDQPFIKDTNMKVKDLLGEFCAKIGENIVIRRFTRYQLGEKS